MAAVVQPEAFRHPYFLLTLVSFGTAGFLAWLAWQRRRRRAVGLSFVAFMAAESAWAFSALLRIAFNGGALEVFALQLWGTTAQLTGVLWVLFAFHYVDRPQYRSSLPFLAAVGLSVLIVVAYWTNPFLELLWTDTTVVAVDGIALLDPVDTPLVVAEFGVMFGYALGGLGLLIRNATRGSTRVGRRQSLLLAVAGLITLAAGSLAILQTYPDAPMPITATSFVFSSVFIFWAVYGYRFLDILPVARRNVIEAIDQPVVVLDDDDVVLDVNPRVAGLVDVDPADVPGRQLSELFPDHPNLYRDVARRDRLTIDLDVNRGRDRHFKVTQTPLFEGDRRYVGRALLFADVTVERQQRRELERQNERLEAFASTLSHDLRNPLSVAKGYLTLAEESPEDEHFETAATALDRMDGMIDDILNLAREGRTATDTAPVSLREVALEAGAFLVETDGSLDIVTDATVRADEHRLERVFSNLFRNAVEHGGEPAEVRVGVLPDRSGFYVEDNGPGIPEAERDRVFEYGVSEETDGTGLGLAIVKHIVDAHGWQITVATGETLEGARFEVTDVEFVDDAREVSGRGPVG